MRCWSHCSVPLSRLASPRLAAPPSAEAQGALPCGDLRCRSLTDLQSRWAWPPAKARRTCPMRHRRQPQWRARCRATSTATGSRQRSTILASSSPGIKCTVQSLLGPSLPCPVLLGRFTHTPCSFAPLPCCLASSLRPSPQPIHPYPPLLAGSLPSLPSPLSLGRACAAMSQGDAPLGRMDSAVMLRWGEPLALTFGRCHPRARAWHRAGAPAGRDLLDRRRTAGVRRPLPTTHGARKHVLTPHRPARARAQKHTTMRAHTRARTHIAKP